MNISHSNLQVPLVQFYTSVLKQKTKKQKKKKKKTITHIKSMVEQ